MAGTTEWIPLRWPGEWQDPLLVELVRQTPIDCLVVSGGERNLKPIIDRARDAGLAVVAPEGAKQAGVPTVPWTERSKVNWSGAAPVVAISDSLWPGIPARAGGGAGAGPTGVPWVDSNGWFIQLARARAPSKTFWLASDPPPKAQFLRGASYQLAVADAETYGARWVVSLDERLRAGLVARDSQALETWKQLSAALAFFKAQRAWNQYRPLNVMAVISDFAGPNEELAGEVLNLAARRPLPIRILEKSGAVKASFEGLKAIIYPDQQPPGPELLKKLMAFVRSGGLLIAGPKWPVVEGAPAAGDTYERFQVRAVGKGRLAAAKEELLDPYLLVMDAHLLLSHRQDPLHFFNAGTTNSYYTASPDGRQALVQIVNYAMRVAGHPISFTTQERYRAARMWTLGSATPAALEVQPAGRGSDVHLPPLSVYAAVELEK
jgi:hypothetical protein